MGTEMVCRYRGTRRSVEAHAAFDGGHLTLRTLDVCMVWGLFREQVVRARDVRVWLACRELAEQRRLAARKRRASRARPLTPSYARDEVARLTGGGGEAARDSLRRLERVGLLRFRPDGIEFATSPDELDAELETVMAMQRAMPKKRSKFPMPRRTLRMVCGSTTKSTLAAVFGQLIWCCYFHRDGGWSTAGRVKASWIADTFGLSERSVDRARKHLVELGWMDRLEPSDGREHVMENRFGARFEVRLDFARTVGELSTGKSSGNGLSTAGMSPRRARNGARLSPPESNLSLSSRCKHQEPGGQAPQTPRSGFSSKDKKAPDWNHLVPGDLVDVGRLMELFDQAHGRGLLEGDSFTERLNFAAAAQRARARGTANPCGLFRWLVERRQWSHITNSDEEAVRRPLTRYLNGEPERDERSTERTPRRRLSEDALFVQRVLLACRNRGIRQKAVIFREVTTRYPEWTDERWGRALEELELPNDGLGLSGACGVGPV